MLRALLIAMPLSIVILLPAMPIVGARAQSLLNAVAGRCLTDDEVPATERDLYEKSALWFAESLIGDKPEDVYSYLSDELREKISLDSFVRNIRQAVQTFRPFTDLHIAHSYRESQIALVAERTNVPCTTVAHGNMNTPGGRVMIAALPVALQAHVIVEAKAKNNRWAFVFWLFPHEPRWFIGGFYILPITILDRTATDFWNLARQEHQHGHAFNSYLLYATAAQLAYRGADLQLGIQPEISKEMAALEVPSELMGKPPFEWNLSNHLYHVIGIGPIGVGNVFDLRIVHKVAQTGDTEELQRQNQTLIKAFEEAHPEYVEIFDGLAVQAVMPDGSGFGTVEQKRNGQ